jgi:RNA polymerase sigma-70 factor (ECF subfamily)
VTVIREGIQPTIGAVVDAAGATDIRPDAQIVAAVLRGDRRAYALLVARYERGVLATTRRVLREPHLARDAAQDAFVAAYESLGRLRDPSAFGAWLLRIARRMASRLAQRRGIRHAESLPEDHPAPVDPNDGAADLEWALAATAGLPEQERVVVVLRYFEDHDVRTIAAMLGRPVGTVTKQLSRAHERLRQHLRKEGLP